MALNIKNAEVESLAQEISGLTGESKTEAIRVALQERKARLQSQRGSRSLEQLTEFMETQIWSQIPEACLGKGLAYLPVEDELGLGEDGV